MGFARSICAPTGRPPYNPKDLLKLYLYGYLNRVRSSRKLEHEAIRNIEVMWLLKRLKPDFKTIADFRKDNKKAIKAVFRDFNKLCDEWGLFGKELVAIDGTKFRACNSKRNNYSTKKLDKHIKYLDEGYQKSLEKSCQTEISTTDPDPRLMSNSNNNVDVSYNVQTTVDSKHKLIADFKVSQKPNDLGELDNMALRAKKLFRDQDFEVLADKGYYKAEDLKKCVEKGITPYVAKQTYSNGTGDKDFYSDKFKYDIEKNVYICPNDKELYYSRARKSKDKIIGYDYKNYEACKDCQFKSRCTKSSKGRSIFRHVDQDFLDTIDVQTEQNRDKYKMRQMIVEHPFGTIKRIWGAYYFLTKGKISVTAEISLSYLSYNLRRTINILGTQETIRRLRERGKPALA
ncbi:MAG: IS1182 family transposase [Desulfitobacteriaceae bacterium]|nr:IS1182 family transposase [Desulfitobacteriaceae bacterium]